MIDVIGGLLSFLPVLPLVHEIIRPLLVVALLLLIFLGAKKKVVFSKALVISGVCLFVATVIFTLVDYFSYMMLLNSFISYNMMSFLQLLSAADSISILATASFYGLAFVAFWGMMDSIIIEEYNI